MSVGDGVVAGLTDAVFLAQAREDGATGTLRCPSGRRLAVDDVPAIVTAALVVLRDNLDAIPTVVARVPQPAMMMGALIANDELAALGVPRVAVPADGEPKAAAEALRSALVELSARGWTHHDE